MLKCITITRSNANTNSYNIHSSLVCILSFIITGVYKMLIMLFDNVATTDCSFCTYSSEDTANH